ncbi:hypothetical protein CAOG_05637 [Capsaspora owczarzaki ATCC 30864]|uniref:Uncharacterized protein n=1 Tax=Capsaspora owczarzaki (strain ATCC 30864) TaxID=595528 RepID=A0A0D2WSJ9_CAPO3|nr:hypothetical protein CAOG_05637 [Capsaspora owczarzaki ATCC 30864]KJE95155.1 hypothetical protein CAOG_005637 [Capsaspora owczarzaki ATCC 30864]|eukprot:XP_004346310.1 hypothetical protein CAOG_05637 [Capsaspora owczarzaki ATCC 30864]
MLDTPKRTLPLHPDHEARLARRSSSELNSLAIFVSESRALDSPAPGALNPDDLDCCEPLEPLESLEPLEALESESEQPASEVEQVEECPPKQAEDNDDTTLPDSTESQSQEDALPSAKHTKSASLRLSVIHLLKVATIGTILCWLLFTTALPATRAVWSHFTALSILALAVVFARPIASVVTFCNLLAGPSAQDCKLKPQLRLNLHVTKTSLLDEVTMNELFTLALSTLDTNQSLSQSLDMFRSYVLSFDFVIMYRSKLDGSLRGMFLMGQESTHARPDGKSAAVLKVGLALFREGYHGGPWFPLAVLYIVLLTKLSRPFTQVYIIMKCFSIRSYLFAVRNAQECYPRHDMPTPAWEKTVMDGFGRAMTSPSEQYDAVHGVIERKNSHLKKGIAEISEKDKQDPHIRYFEEQNPDWQQGHQLVVMGAVSAGCFCRGVLSAARRYLGNSRWELRAK